MSLIYAICAERLKTKHTSFWAIHICLPTIGALLFIIYYLLYAKTPNEQKLKMILEFTATIFPLLISVVVSLNVTLEEKCSYFQTLLATPNRYKIIFAKLVYLYSSGVFALFCLFLLFVLGTLYFKSFDIVQFELLIKSVIGIAFCNLIIYNLHLFLSFKFGLGLSLFWGVFESLQCILYSNIELKGITWYIPFAWSMNWIQDILNNSLFLHKIEWTWIVIMTIGSLLLTLLWFSNWEGRNIL